MDDTILDQNVWSNDLCRSSVAAHDEGAGRVLSELQRLASRIDERRLRLRRRRVRASTTRGAVGSTRGDELFETGTVDGGSVDVL